MNLGNTKFQNNMKIYDSTDRRGEQKQKSKQMKGKQSITRHENRWTKRKRRLEWKRTGEKMMDDGRGHFYDESVSSKLNRLGRRTRRIGPRPLPVEDCTLQSGMCNPRKSSMAPRRPALTMTNRRESSFRWNEIRKRRTCSGGRIFGGVKKETRWMADRAALIEFFRHCFAPGFDWNVHRVN